MSDNNHNDSNLSSLQGFGHRSHFENQYQIQSQTQQRLHAMTSRNANGPKKTNSPRFSTPATHSWRVTKNSSQKFDFNRASSRRINRYKAQTMRHSHSHGQQVIPHHVQSNQGKNNHPKTFRMSSYNVHGNRRSRNGYTKKNQHQQNAEQKKQEVLKQGKKLEQFMSEMHHIFHQHHFDNKHGVRRTILWQLFQQEKEHHDHMEIDADNGDDNVNGSGDDNNDENGNIHAMDLTASQFRTLLQQANHLGLVNIEFRKIDPNDQNCIKQVFIHLCENGLGVPQIVKKLQQSNVNQTQAVTAHPTRAQTARASGNSSRKLNIQNAHVHNMHGPNMSQTPTMSMFDYSINAAVASPAQAQFDLQAQTSMMNGLNSDPNAANDLQSMQLALATQQMQLQMQYQGMHSQLPQLQQLNQFGQFGQSMQSPMQHAMQTQQSQFQQLPNNQLQETHVRGQAQAQPQMQRRRSSEFTAKTIKCSFCGKMFYNERGLKQHSLQRHAKALGFEYTCKYCNYHFTNQIEYNQHLNEAHINEVSIVHGAGTGGPIVAGVASGMQVQPGFAAIDISSTVA